MKGYCGDTRVLPNVMGGLAGGLVGSSAIILFNRLLASTGLGDDDLGRHHQRHHVDAKPNDADATISDEPGSIKAAARGADAAGVHLSEAERRAAGAVVHHAFGAFTGAVYGALAAAAPVVTVGAGAPYGAAVWVAAAEAGMPLSGLARRPGDYPPARHVASLASHLVYGLTLESVRRAVIRAWKSRERRARFNVE